MLPVLHKPICHTKRRKAESDSSLYNLAVIRDTDVRNHINTNDYIRHANLERDDKRDIKRDDHHDKRWIKHKHRKHNECNLIHKQRRTSKRQHRRSRCGSRRGLRRAPPRLHWHRLLAAAATAESTSAKQLYRRRIRILALSAQH